MIMATVTMVVCILAVGAANGAIRSVRLRGGATPSEGKVEVIRGVQWGAVCDDGWGRQEAEVVCRELGFKGAKRELTNSHYGAARGPIWIKSVRCSGEEEQLSQCVYTEISQHIDLYEQVDEVNECATSHLAGVVCVDEPGPEVIELGERLARSRESRLVKIRFEGTWYPVCANTWRSKESIVACKHLGLYANLTKKAKIGQHDVNGLAIPRYPAAISRIRCKGTERSLHECKIHTGTTNCNKTYAAISCSEYAPDISVNITELESTISLTKLRESEIICAKSERCLSPSGMKKSHKFLRKSKFKRKLLVFSSNVQNFGNADFIPPPRKGGWAWHECHKHYHSISQFAKYDLKSATDETVIVSGHKVSFCLEDSECVSGGSRKYVCGDNDKRELNQGISAGCADHYTYNLDCQWIDITDVPDGPYYLDIVSNPFMLVPEQDYSNNYIRCQVLIQQTIAVGWNCHHPADFDFSTSMLPDDTEFSEDLLEELDYLY